MQSADRPRHKRARLDEPIRDDDDHHHHRIVTDITNIQLKADILGSSPESEDSPPSMNLLERLPLDLLLSIFACISSTASSPRELIGPRLTSEFVQPDSSPHDNTTCRRFKALASHPLVLSKACLPCLSIDPSAWCNESRRYLQQCADAGNMEACYILGMIQFYCLGERGGGMAMMGRAAMAGHKEALYSLGIVFFNGSGGRKGECRNLRAGIWLCARAACLGHLDAMRELGHCLHDGYGVLQNAAQARKLLLHVHHAQEAVGPLHHRHRHRHHLHASNRFLVRWFALARPPFPAASGLRLCSHGACGRIETRRHEFRRCSDCGLAHYCSRSCQAMDWKLRHKLACRPRILPHRHRQHLPLRRPPPPPQPHPAATHTRS